MHNGVAENMPEGMQESLIRLRIDPDLGTSQNLDGRDLLAQAFGRLPHQAVIVLQCHVERYLAQRNNFIEQRAYFDRRCIDDFALQQAYSEFFEPKDLIA